MLFERIFDGGAYIFFIELLPTNIHHFRLPAHKSDERTIVIKIHHLNNVVQTITVETAPGSNDDRISTPWL